MLRLDSYIEQMTNLIRVTTSQLAWITCFTHCGIPSNHNGHYLFLARRRGLIPFFDQGVKPFLRILTDQIQKIKKLVLRIRLTKVKCYVRPWSPAHRTQPLVRTYTCIASTKREKSKNGKSAIYKSVQKIHLQVKIVFCLQRAGKVKEEVQTGQRLFLTDFLRETCFHPSFDRDFQKRCDGLISIKSK